MRGRSLAVAALVSTSFLSLLSQTKNQRSNPGSECGDQSPWRRDLNFYNYYRMAVLNQLNMPPDWKSGLLKLTLYDGEVPLDLWTDGTHSKLWTFKAVPPSIQKYLDELSDSCRLPGNPSAAAAL